MRTLEEILDAARQLPQQERQQLARTLQHELSEPDETERQAALKTWLELAGSVHADVDDVAADNGKHLAEVYADER